LKLLHFVISKVKIFQCYFFFVGHSWNTFAWEPLDPYLCFLLVAYMFFFLTVWILWMYLSFNYWSSILG
jgi:hypothetical protein